MASSSSKVSLDEDKTTDMEPISEKQDEEFPLIKVTPKKDDKLILYHWTQSFSSQKFFLSRNGDSIEEDTPKLIPEEGSMYYPRVQHYRELLDSLPMDAYTHGCILHPEITVDSQIPAYATTRIRSQIENTESELKKLAHKHPELQEAYVAKQKRLKSKLLDHDNMKYVKKILDELEKVLDQVETELQRRNEETPEEGNQPWLCGQFFSVADVSLAVTLHRMKFLGLSRRYWGNGDRQNVETYYERVLKRKTFRRVLGNVNNILISAVLPTAFRVAKKRAPSFLGTTLAVGILGGMSYFAFLYIKKRLISVG
ncbi:UNVERIFIED_CONTAM: hypothetical protein FKN15_061036 [Acipenser sinensis]